MTFVVFVLVDALRADHLGPYGGTGTPVADRLAAEGVVFDNAVAQASSTRPSVASLMTGLYPSQHGLADRWKTDEGGNLAVAVLDPAVPTLAELLAGAGIPTAAFLGGNANMKPLFGLTRGFTHIDWRPTTDGEAICSGFESWLAAERPERAFCYLHFMDVHHPLPETIPSRLDKGLDMSTVAESMEELLAYYARAVSTVDAHLARVLRALEASGRYEDALILLTADHGEELGEHGAVLAHGRTLYRELVRVPLIVRLPRAERAGTRIGDPVGLIDLAPTILQAAGRDAPASPGRSLLPLIRGEDPSPPGHAFSELLRRDRYAQSVTTERHHLIESFLLEEVPEASPDDLREGVWVQVKGEPTEDGPFVPTKISFKDVRRPKVRGVIDAVNAEGGRIEVFGLTLHIGPETEFLSLDKESFAFQDLVPGDKISAAFERGPHGRLMAARVKRRKTGGKSKVEGVIERVREQGGVRWITVLGLDVPVGEQVTISPPRHKTGEKRDKGDALSRVLAGDFVEKRRELYEHAADPAEAHDLAEGQPDVAKELEALLGPWTTSLVSGIHAPGGSVDVDQETLEQLRRMGYVD